MFICNVFCLIFALKHLKMSIQISANKAILFHSLYFEGVFETAKVYTNKNSEEHVLCHQSWLKIEADEIQKDKNYAGHK